MPAQRESNSIERNLSTRRHGSREYQGEWPNKDREPAVVPGAKGADVVEEDEVTRIDQMNIVTGANKSTL
jgi:hypothetical protein